MKEQEKNIILLGNSLNLLEDAGQSWESIVETFENSIEGNNIDPGVDRKQIPFVFRMNQCFNRWHNSIENNSGEKVDIQNAADNKHCGEEGFRTLCSRIGDLRPNAMHVELMKLIGDSQILTTNYDYAIESALAINRKCSNGCEKGYDRYMPKNDFAILNNLTRRHEQVWHIHGEADVPESLIIDSDGYARGLVALKTYGHHELTWLNLFLNSGVHILGLELRYTESLLWYALQSRLEIPQDERKPVNYYHFVRTDDEKEIISATNLKYVLSAYDVNYCRIDVNKMEGGYNYRKAWTELLETLKGEMYPEDKPEKVPSYPPFRISYPSFNIVASKTPTAANPTRCWMNIVVDKLNEFDDANRWIFDCFVHNKRYVYSISVKELKASLTDSMIMNNEPRRYSFYINYANGILYEKVSDDTPLVKLQKVEDGSLYEKYRIHKDRNR